MEMEMAEENRRKILRLEQQMSLVTNHLMYRPLTREEFEKRMKEIHQKSTSSEADLKKVLEDAFHHGQGVARFQHIPHERLNRDRKERLNRSQTVEAEAVKKDQQETIFQDLDSMWKEISKFHEALEHLSERISPVDTPARDTGMRRFILWQYYGCQALGGLAEGVQFSNGSCTLSWHNGERASYHSIAELESIHGPEGHQRIEWLD